MDEFKVMCEICNHNTIYEALSMNSKYDKYGKKDMIVAAFLSSELVTDRSKLMNFGKSKKKISKLIENNSLCLDYLENQNLLFLFKYTGSSYLFKKLLLKEDVNLSSFITKYNIESLRHIEKDVINKLLELNTLKDRVTTLLKISAKTVLSIDGLALFVLKNYDYFKGLDLCCKEGLSSLSKSIERILKPDRSYFDNELPIIAFWFEHTNEDYLFYNSLIEKSEKENSKIATVAIDLVKCKIVDRFISGDMLGIDEETMMQDEFTLVEDIGTVFYYEKIHGIHELFKFECGEIVKINDIDEIQNNYGIYVSYNDKWVEVHMEKPKCIDSYITKEPNHIKPLLEISRKKKFAKR